MLIQSVLFFSSYFIICSIILGYGQLFKVLVFNNYKNISEIGFTGLIGFLFLYLISSLIIFFSSINNYISLFILFFGIVSFVFYLFYKKFDTKSLLILFLILILFIPMAIISEPTEDFFFYYQPYMNYLSSSKIIFGLVNVNSTLAFSTYSLYDVIIFFKIQNIIENSFSIPIMIFYVFYIVFLIELLLKRFNLFNFIILFLSIVTFTNLRDIGTTVPPQLLLMLCSSLIYNFLLNGINEDDFSKLLLLLCLAIVLRFNSIIILPLILRIFVRYYNFIYLYFFNNKKIIFFTTFVILIYFSKNIIASGCLIYPVSNLCLEKLDWSSNIQVTKQKYNKLSSDSKGWPFYAKENFEINEKFVWKNLNKKNFVNYNDYNKTSPLFWIKYWFKDPNYKKIVNLFLISLLFFLVLNIKKNGKIENNKISLKDYFFLLFSVLAIIIFWFYVSPQMRYGGYFSFIIFFSLIFSFINNYKYKKIHFFSLVFSILIAFSYLSLKNIKRISSDILEKKFTNFPWPNNHELIKYIDYEIFEKDNKIYFKRLRTDRLLFDNGEQAILMCGDIDFPCIPEGKEICLGERKYYGIFIAYKKNQDEEECLKFMNRNILY